jgi:acyl dehydratase
MRVLAPLRLGGRITTEIRCVGKELRRERRFVDVGSRSVDETGAVVAEGTLRLIWAA